jgi:hypothetical protein
MFKFTFFQKQHTAKRERGAGRVRESFSKDADIEGGDKYP